MCNSSDITAPLSSIIIQPMQSPLPGNYYGAHKIGDKKRTFLAHVFYLEASNKNDPHRAALRDGAVVNVHSFIPPDEVASPNMKTIKLNHVAVTFINNGIPQIHDRRAADAVPGTDAFKKRVQAVPYLNP